MAYQSIFNGKVALRDLRDWDMAAKFLHHPWMNRNTPPSFAAEHDDTFAAITSPLFDRKSFVARAMCRMNARRVAVHLWPRAAKRRASASSDGLNSLCSSLTSLVVEKLFSAGWRRFDQPFGC
jgi:hypothetical protein